MIVEIIGPSGAGKSTLSRLLNERSPHIKAGFSIWGQPRLDLAMGLLFSGPSLLESLVTSSQFGYEDAKQIIRSHAFHAYLSRTSRERSRAGTGYPATFFVDEGCVFSIAKMRYERSKNQRPTATLRWEDRIVSLSARYLKAVVWLDAPDRVLIGRIRDRSKSHRMKSSSDSEIEKFLGLYREAYGSVVRNFKDCGNIRVLKFDTSSVSLESIAGQLSSVASSGVLDLHDQ